MKTFLAAVLSVVLPSISLAGEGSMIPVRITVRMLGLSPAAVLPADRSLNVSELKQLTESDQLQWSRHFEVITLDECEAVLQVGETNNVVTALQSVSGRNLPGGRGNSPEEDARRAAMIQAMQGRTSRSTTKIQTGTLVEVTPRVMDDRSIVMSVALECSRLAPAGEDDSGIPSRETQLLSVQSTVLVRAGEPAIMRATVHSEDPSTSSQALIVIDATAIKAAE